MVISVRSQAEEAEMKKVGGIFLLVVVTLAVAGYLFLGVVVERGSRKGLRLLASEAERHGVRVVGSGFRDARYRFPAAVMWRDVYGEVEAEEEGPFSLGRMVSVHIGSLSLAPGSMGTPLSLSAERIEVVFRGEGHGVGKSREESIIRGDWAIAGLAVSLGSPESMKGQLREAARKFESFLQEGKAEIPVIFSGTATFSVQGKIHHARILVKREGVYSVLRMNGDDIMKISGEFSLKSPLTDAEVDLLSRHPLKAPRLLDIRSYARSESKKAWSEDMSVPEDAFRHVLWSYLLTKEYGAEFAKLVTDAHEEGLTGNTAAEKRMDLQNNMVGRRYGRRSVPEKEILNSMMSDPNVIMSP
jgi:hypothetical protein